jgi:hypothetical protein
VAAGTSLRSLRACAGQFAAPFADRILVMKTIGIILLLALTTIGLSIYTDGRFATSQVKASSSEDPPMMRGESHDIGF